MATKISILTLCFLFLSVFAFSQSEHEAPNREIISISINSTDYEMVSKHHTLPGNLNNFFKTIVKIPVSKSGPFIAFSISWENKTTTGSLQQFLFQSAGSLNEIHLNHHIEKPADQFHSELVFLPADSDSLFLIGVTELSPDLQLSIHFFNPGFTDPRITENFESQNPRSSVCPCPQPDILTRNEWCPNGDCPASPSPNVTIASHLIVHHSAGTNTASDWPAVVRSIWNFHVNTLGWGDVGYNWLVDPEGNLYEGRGKDVLGAHFCGTNSKTAGICLLGTYTDVAPQIEMIQSLKEMLAWYCCVDDIDPLGISFHSGSSLQLNNISGHRDGCATECPGETFYPTLTGLRMEVADHITSDCTNGISDVLVETIATNPDTVYANEVVILITSIKNQGNVPAENIEITRSLNGNVLATNFIAILNPGDTETISNSYIFTTETIAEFCVSVTPVDNEEVFENNDACLDIEVNSTVSTKRIENIGLSVFPNPGSGHFYIKNPMSKIGNITVYSSIGENIFMAGLNQNQHLIDLTTFPKGVYFMKIKVNGKQYFEKIIIQ